MNVLLVWLILLPLPILAFLNISLFLKIQLKNVCQAHKGEEMTGNYWLHGDRTMIFSGMLLPAPAHSLF
jgi:hypothetical protein